MVLTRCLLRLTRDSNKQQEQRRGGDELPTRIISTSFPPLLLYDNQKRDLWRKCMAR